MSSVDLAGVAGFLIAMVFGYLSNRRYELANRRMDGVFLFYVAAVGYFMCVWLFMKEAGAYPSIENISPEKWGRVKGYLIVRVCFPISVLAISRSISGERKYVSLTILFVILALAVFDMYYVHTIFPRYAGVVHG